MLLSCYGYDKSYDSYNVYYSSEHFRTVAGVAYKDSLGIYDLAVAILDAAELTWQKEVDELGFIKPRNSENKFLDIYIANMSAYNPESESYELIPSIYAGWSTAYPSDNTPYFVLNPSMNEEQLKVTIAHEFFHTIQLSYFDETKIDDTKWFKNIWWLEATAVLLEDEVFDEINDYVRFLNPFF